MSGIAGDEGQIVNEGGCGDQRIGLRSFDRDMELSAAQRHRFIDRDNAGREMPTDVLLDPDTQKRRVRQSPSGGAQGANLYFHQRDGGNVEILGVTG